MCGVSGCVLSEWVCAVSGRVWSEWMCAEWVDVCVE